MTMRYSLRAPIDGNLVLYYPNRRVATTRNGIELSLEIGEKGAVSHATASIQVSNDNRRRHESLPHRTPPQGVD